LYKGFVSGVAYQCCMNGVRLGLYPTVKRRLFNSDGGANDSFLKSLGAGVVSSGVGAVCGSPAYLIKTRMQMRGR
jgi:hypothetical protein